MGTLVNGIKEIFATAKTTGSNVMLCGNDGTPDGHMTMANLASVLGGINGVVDNEDTLSGSANNVITNSFYHIQDKVHTVTDIPDVCKSNSNLVTIVSVSRKANTKIVIQFLYKQTDGRSFIRIGYAGSFNGTNITWEHDWQEYTLNMPTFYKDYNNLSALADALGAKRLNVRFDGDKKYVCDLYISPDGTAYLQDNYAQNIANFPVTVLI